MKILNYYYYNIIKYNVLYKFNIKNLNSIPKLKKVILNFRLKRYEFKHLIIILAALKLISNTKTCKLISSKVSNINLKLRKGTPIGSKVVLKKNTMDSFLFKILSFKLCFLYSKSKNKVFSFKINNLLKFKKIEQNYKFFKFLPLLSINIITNSKTKYVFIFLMKSYKFF